MSLPVAVILLAAGSSSRMGQSKQLLDIQGKPLLVRAAEAALGTDAVRTIVVLGANEPVHRQLIQDLPLEIIYNPDWEKGMGISLQRGLLHALTLLPELEAAMIVVCDQPLVTGRYLTTLIQKYKATKKAILASRYSDTVGVPALFDKSLFRALLALEDRQGAKKIIMAHPESVLSIDFPGGAIDLDTPNDYQTFLKQGDPTA